MRTIVSGGSVYCMHFILNMKLFRNSTTQKCIIIIILVYKVCILLCFTPHVMTENGDNHIDINVVISQTY